MVEHMKHNQDSMRNKINTLLQHVRMNRKTKHNRKMNGSYPPMRSDDPDP